MMKANSANRQLQTVFALVVFGWSVAAGSTASAQGYGAIQAVRGRVSGLGAAPQGELPPGPGPGVDPGQPSSAGGPAAGALGKLDTSYVSPTATIVISIRPAQIMASPLVQLLPTEVATMAAQQYLGIELSTVDEVVAFGEMTNPMAPTFGITVKFNTPFRAATLPPHIRPLAKLAEFNGKKYLQSSHPIWPSFYGPNNKTLVVAPDAVLRKIVPAASEPKSGALMERLQDAPAGNDLYVAVDMVAMRGIMPLMLGSAGVAISPKAKPILEGTTAAELTLNLVSRGPVSFVFHCTDDAAAQQVEQAVNEYRQQQAIATAGPGPGPGSDPAAPPSPEAGPGPGPGPSAAPSGPFAQAFAQYQERMMQRFQVQRNGNSVVCLSIAADDPLQQQLFGIVLGAAMTAQQMPKIMEMQQKAMAARGKQSGSRPPGPPATAGPEGGATPSPGSPGPDATGPEAGSGPEGGPSAGPERQ